MSNTPLVSVIVPMYKVEEYLRECLDSVVNQTLKSLEILCVDDGSPDNSGAIAESYAAKYPFVKVIHKENGGLSSARNAGLDAATGRYVYFLDSDDFLEPETLETLSARAESEQLDIVYFNTQMLFESRKVRALNQNYIDYYTRRHSYDGVFTGQSLFAAMRENREFFPSVCLQLFRRSMIEDNRIRFYHGILHEDNLFSFQTMILAQRAGYDSGSYYHRRMHGDSIMTAGKSIRNVEGYLVTYAEILAFMRDREVEEAAFDQISEFLYTSVWGNGRRIFQGLDIPEQDAVLSHGDFVAQHFLDMAKRCGETEFDRSRIKSDNDQLRLKLQQLQRWTRFSILRIFFAIVQCLRDHGLVYTAKLAVKKSLRLARKIDDKLRRIPPYRWLTSPFRQLFHRWKISREAEGRTPLVSIILPVYNVEEYLEECIGSLISQSLKRIEIIAVDDGSTDRSLEILKDFAARDSRVKVFTQKNKFAGAARNLGLRHAQGEYVIFLDSDDFFEPNLAKDAYLAAKKHKADVVLFGARHFNHTTKEFKEAKWLLNIPFAPKKQPFNYWNCPDSLYRITTPAPWTKMFRRAFVQKHKLQFQHIQNANDLFFTYSALAMAQKIVTVNKALVNYRVGLQTNLQTTKKKYPFCFYDAYKAWHDKLAELGALDTLRRSYVNVALSGCMHNLRTNKDLDVKRMVFDRLKEEILAALEIPGHEASYYYVPENYRDMQLILNGTFEDYLAATQPQEAPKTQTQLPAGDLPGVSVIIPTRDAKPYLEGLIQSLQAQSYGNWEAIFADYGSRDGSLALVAEAAKQDSRIRCVQLESDSSGTARNHGFAQARGEFALFLDSNDLCTPNMLETLLTLMAQHGADIAACNYDRVLTTGKALPQTGIHTGWLPKDTQVFSYRDCPDYILRVIAPKAWNKLYRSDFLRRENLTFDATTSVNDLAFSAVSVAAAGKVAYTTEALVQYRDTVFDKTGKLSNDLTAMESALEKLKRLPHRDAIRNAILSFTAEHYIGWMKSDISDFSHPDAEKLYRKAHETFNRAEFAAVDAKTFHNPRLYRDFCTVRKHDYEAMQTLTGRRLIVSLTTYPRRIGTLHKVLETVYAQTRKADEVVLWLAPSQFPGREADLPGELTQLVEAGKLTIRWCADLKPHKKYFYALQEYDNDLVVTVDDDLLYSETMLQSLYESYLLYPEAVSTVRAHLMLLEDGKILPYSTWIQETDQCIHTPSMQLVATGGAGVLYPPKLFRKEFFNEQTVMELCPWADDLWLKVMQTVSGIPVVVAREHEDLRYLDGTQAEALHQVNVSQNQNDAQLAQVSQWLDRTFEPGILVKCLTAGTPGQTILGLEAITHHVDQERKALRRKVGPMETRARQAEAQSKTATQELRKAEQALRNTQQKLWRTEARLHYAEETRPVGRQLRVMGEQLYKQKQEKGKTPGILAKYFVYYTAWVPAKWLALHMYCLQNGLKQTLKKLLKRG